MPGPSRLGSVPGAHFLRELRRFDEGLDLIWHPVLNRWILYRVVHRGSSRPSDQLLKELVLEGSRGEYREPGTWLIDTLRRMDKTLGGSLDPAVANFEILRRQDEEEKRRERTEERARSAVSEETARDLWRYAVKERRHFPRYLRHPGRRPS